MTAAEALMIVNEAETHSGLSTKAPVVVNSDASTQTKEPPKFQHQLKHQRQGMLMPVPKQTPLVHRKLAFPHNPVWQ